MMPAASNELTTRIANGLSAAFGPAEAGEAQGDPGLWGC